MKRKLVVTLAMLMASSMVFTGCGASNNSSANSSASSEVSTSADGEYVLAEDQTLRVNIVSDPLTLDPQLNQASDGSHIIGNAFEGLVRELDGEIVLGVAENYEVSEDGCTYTFTLREDAKWSDGQPVTAGDFEYAWKRGADPATASEYMYIFSSANIKNAKEIANGEESIDNLGVVALDDRTLQVTLNVPTEFFLELCSTSTFKPVRSDVVDETGVWAKDPAKAISNGPFKLSEYKMGDQLVYVKNENYWNAESVELEKIIYYMIGDESTAHTRYTSGELDVNEWLPADELPTLIAEDPTMYVLPKVGTYYFAFNFTKEIAQDVNVRKALSLAIDREQIVSEVTKGGQTAAYGYMPEAVLDSQGNVFSEMGGEFFSTKADVEKAKEYLAAAGYPDGVGFPEIEILYNTSESHKKIAESIQEMLKQNLGINVKITNQEWAVFQDTTKQHEFEGLARRGWIGDYTDAQTMLEIFESTNGQNIGAYVNETFDAEMAAAKTTTGAERDEHLYNAYKILMEDMPIIPVYYYTYPIMIQDTVADWDITAMGHYWFGDAKKVVVEE